MDKIGSNFLEKHVEKVVVGLIGLICIWLLITRVLISPNNVEWDEKKFNVGRIDTYIRERADNLEDQLGRRPEPVESYQPRYTGPISDDDTVKAGIRGDLSGGFVGLVDSSIGVIDTSLFPPQPCISSLEVSDGRVYNLPVIGDVNDVKVDFIRAVAYVPAELVHQNRTYSEAEHEPNDIDLVTVEAAFDTDSLYERFYESFAGEDIHQQWRDPCLAVPVFAAVELQRQEQLSDNSWSHWQTVPRTRIEARREMFEVVEKFEDLPIGGIELRLIQFNNRVVLMDLLQPESYKIASEDEEWFPPSLHEKFLKLEGEIAADQRRKEIETKQQEREKTTAGRVGGRTPRGRRSGGGMGIEEESGPGMNMRRAMDRRGNLTRRTDRLKASGLSERLSKKDSLSSMMDLYKEFEDILITDQTDLAKMRKPLVFWAHDDTVELGRVYRYRNRLGVFNSIVGTNQFGEKDKPLKNKVVLWSKFSDVTDAVEIPKRLYFFPREVQEASRTVTMTISRYALGYWYSSEFKVKPGEVIGKVIETQTEDKNTDEQDVENLTIPETIDYSAGAVLVDVVLVSDWLGPKLRARHHFDMLYSFDGTGIERVAIKSKNWSEQLRHKYNEIKKSEKIEKKPLRAWGSKRSGRRGTMRPGMGIEEDDEEEMFMY